LSIATIKHCPLRQPSNAIFTAATLCHLVFICHRHCLLRHPLLLSNIAARHCHPLPQPSNAIFAAAALCHLPLLHPLNAFKRHHPI
jgi:hypothetical protein